MTNDERKECSVKGCDRPSRSNGTGKFCDMHYYRMRRRGDVNFEYQGDSHPAWVGDEVGYRAMHNRVAKACGKASNYRCVDCDAAANQWSYSHSDPNEKIDSRNIKYSTDIGHYRPRCYSCHVKLDGTPRQRMHYVDLIAGG